MMHECEGCYKFVDDNHAVNRIKFVDAKMCVHRQILCIECNSALERKIKPRKDGQKK